MHGITKRSNRASVLFAAAFLAIAPPPPLQAQAAAGDALAFPRDMLTSYLGGESQRVWDNAAPALREMFGSAAAMRAAASEISADMGTEEALLSEQRFEHPDGGGAHVYVRAIRHTKVPEIFWIVIFTPADRKVHMIMPQPRQTIRTIFPAVRLP
jgi:hypothetical protein